MSVLVVSSRFPWPPYTGDRMRASIWIAALSAHTRVVLVAPPGAGEPPCPYVPARRSLARGLGGGLRVLRDGLPWQTVLAAPYDWDAAIAAARKEHGPFDTVVVMLSRVDPWIRGALNGERKILDAVDSLRRNAEERAKAGAAPLGWLWRGEARRLARLEEEEGRLYDHVIVVSGDETTEFGGAATAIHNSVPVRPLAATERRFDFAFWGRLAYFANADAAHWLLDEIWPAIRERLPSATLAIAGADAPRALRRKAEQQGVTLLSPVEDVAAFARSVRVAIIPMRYGSGQSSKLLEAAEAGCAIVTTPQALRGLAPLAPHVSVAADAPSLASGAVAASATGTAAAEAAAAQLREIVAAHYSRDRIHEQMAEVATA